MNPLYINFSEFFLNAYLQMGSEFFTQMIKLIYRREFCD